MENNKTLQYGSVEIITILNNLLETEKELLKMKKIYEACETGIVEISNMTTERENLIINLQSALTKDNSNIRRETINVCASKEKIELFRKII